MAWAPNEFRDRNAKNRDHEGLVGDYKFLIMDNENQN